MAPVHQVVWTGKDADFTRLPVHLQHGHDGGPYISARRHHQEHRRQKAKSRISQADAAWAYRGGRRYDRAERLSRHVPGVCHPQGANAVAFIVGSHPADSVAATAMSLIDDEVELMGALRGSAVPLVRCVTIDAMCRPMPRSFSKATWTNAGGWNPRARSANTSVTTAA